LWRVQRFFAAACGSARGGFRSRAAFRYTAGEYRSSALAGFQAPPRRRKGRFVIMAALALALAACGRKGDPLPPPDPNAPSPTPSANSNPGIGMGPPPNPPIARPTTPFLLDPLLK
jgi:predicted small lipoprotein YifL